MSRRRTSRDEMVTEGTRAAIESEMSHRAGNRTSPWLYDTKSRSGRKPLRIKQYEAWNLKHLKGEVIQDQARNNETLSITMIARVMKANLTSYREDV